MLRRQLLAVSVGLVLLAGCGGGGNDEPSAGEPEPAPPTTVEPATTTGAPPTETTPPPTSAGSAADVTTVPDVVGMDLQAAQDALQAEGFFFLGSHDATGQDRYQVVDRNWTVCDQSPPGGSPAGSDAEIDLGAVKDEEACP